MRNRWLAGVTMLALIPGLALGLFSTARAENAEAYLGVAVGPMPEDADHRGAIIHEVVADSPGAKAGLQKGDIIVKMGERDIHDPKAVVETVAGHKPGDTLTCHVLRDGKDHACAVTLGERTAQAEPELPSRLFARTAFLGVWTQEMTQEQKDELGVGCDKGAVVMEVMPDSPASTAGLKTHDVITQVNDMAVTGPQQLKEAVHKIGVDQEATFFVCRGQEAKEIKVKLAAMPVQLGWFRDLDARWPTFGEGRDFPVPPEIDRELERRFEELQRRIRALEEKHAQPSK